MPGHVDRQRLQGGIMAEIEVVQDRHCDATLADQSMNDWMNKG